MRHTKSLTADAIVQPFVVFTDLDGTLLDHDTYDWRPAESTLQQLKRREIPVVLISSKTLAELAVYRQDIGFQDPVVAENGAAIDVPPDYFTLPCDFHKTVVSRDALQREFVELRRECDVSCSAFFELGTEGIVRATGLTPAQAELANQRDASEPVLWQDTPEALTTFCDRAEQAGLRCLRGGRFVHLMGQTDKVDAMTSLLAAYRQEWSSNSVTSVALGDSPNDLGMLQAADIAVVIPAHHDVAMDLPGHANVLRPSQRGPEGWRTAMQTILSTLDTETENLG
ncbi:MAG: HAD-IIB family hydrolase [Gammaproteobacteria bacterium]